MAVRQARSIVTRGRAGGYPQARIPLLQRRAPRFDRHRVDIRGGAPL